MRLQEFSKLPIIERDRLADELGRKAQAPRNGQAKDIDSRIRGFEIQYEMTSADMQKRFASGDLRDTSDVSRWLMLLRVRER